MSHLLLHLRHLISLVKSKLRIRHDVAIGHHFVLVSDSIAILRETMDPSAKKRWRDKQQQDAERVLGLGSYFDVYCSSESSDSSDSDGDDDEAAIGVRRGTSKVSSPQFI